MINLRAHGFHLSVLDLLEEPFLLLLVFIYLIFFFTDDKGTYYFPTRDFHPPSDDYRGKREQLENYLAEHRKEYESYVIRGYTFQKRFRTWIHIIHGLRTMKDLHLFFLSQIWLNICLVRSGIML